MEIILVRITTIMSGCLFLYWIYSINKRVEQLEDKINNDETYQNPERRKMNDKGLSVIISHILKNGEMRGYDLRKALKQFDITWISAPSFYETMFHLEQKGLVKSIQKKTLVGHTFIDIRHYKI
jgi:hypothetical protein